MLTEVTPLTAKERMNTLREDNGYSGTYMNQLHGLAKQAMDAAEAEEIIDRNPFDRIKAPRIDTKPREALGRERFVSFLEKLDAQPLDYHTVALRLAVMGGMRRGEICYLPWMNVAPGVIKVRNALGEDNRPKDPKTMAGIRDIPMMAKLESDLARWKAVQSEHLGALNIVQTPETPVCANSQGGRLNPQNLDRWWRGKRASYGLEGVVLHELRHTFLTLLASSASTASLKSIAGWATIAMADTYVHDDPVANAQAVSRMDSLIRFPSN